jgi:hypothetical protein
MKFIKIISFLGLIFTSVLLASCTQNARARKFGGTAVVNLPPQIKLVNVTFKDSDLWILTRKMRAEEPVETYEFTEQSSYGILEGKVIINERQ